MARLRDFDRNREDVTFAAHGFDIGRFARIVAQPLTQPADQKIDRAVEEFGVATLRQAQKLIAVQDTLGMVDEDAKQAVFGAAQRNRGPVLVEQMPGDRVEPPLAEREQLSRFADLQVGRQHARAPQHRLDTGEQFTRGEGLGKIVVCAHLQPEDPVHLVRARRQHQDRDRLVPAGAEFAAQHQPVIAGHHHVEHDQVDGIGIQKTAHLAPVRGNAGPQAILLQIAGDQLADFTIVVDDQDVIDMIHICSSSTLWPRPPPRSGTEAPDATYAYPAGRSNELPGL
ncbi:hypothetical protein RHECNPAF_6420057 [Rhizobium etli CNPAF512]|nr:hypothetical protein RHECNPAF_6420057 [Rhizobium etli CNPAF512]